MLGWLHLFLELFSFSALAMLKPWVNVWNSSTMSAFLGQHIIPKLERFLEAMPLTPMDFRPDNWKALVSWMEIISHEIMANILTKYLFPRVCLRFKDIYFNLVV